MIMRRILCVLSILAVIASCGNGNNKKAAVDADENLEKNRVEVLVFYGAQRCATCRAIEAQSRELVEAAFAEELSSGLLVYRTVDMTTPEPVEQALELFGELLDEMEALMTD